MALTGLVGWRGMVGSVLMQRMREEDDFAHIEPVFFSTSNIGGDAPPMAKNETRLKDAFDVDALKRCDVVMCFTTGGKLGEPVENRVRVASNLKPELTSLNAGSLVDASFPGADGATGSTRQSRRRRMCESKTRVAQWRPSPSRTFSAYIRSSAV